MLFSVAVTVLSLCCLSPILLRYVAFRGHVACQKFNLKGASEVECIFNRFTLTCRGSLDCVHLINEEHMVSGADNG